MPVPEWGCSPEVVPTDQTVRVEQFPTFYISHGGGPCFFMPDPQGHWTGLGRFLTELPASLPRRPRAVLVITAHWEASVVTIDRGPNPELIYDYFGFPDYTYELEYRAPGSPGTALRIGDALRSAGVDHLLDPAHGWDHGVFVPLKVIFPDADVPIVAMSLRHDLDPDHHLAVGRALRSLRDDVLIIGSGSSFHNLSHWSPDASQLFDSWLAETLPEAGTSRSNALRRWSSAPGAQVAHPREEHLLPLMVAVGAAETEPGDAVFRGPAMGAMMSCWRFGGQ